MLTSYWQKDSMGNHRLRMQEPQETSATVGKVQTSQRSNLRMAVGIRERSSERSSPGRLACLLLVSPSPSLPPLSNPNSKCGQLHAMSPKVPCPAPGLRAFVYSPSVPDAFTYPCSLPGSFSVFRAPLGGHLFQEAFPVPARQCP